ncbi:MAG: hypothetical protein QOF30_3108, partial [Acidimicrobiaceae bacterium]|nr:hypothetical protein [Acidimicrobiaceae bacterium]
QDITRQLPGLFGPGLGGADDNEIIGEPGERPQATPGTLPLLVENVERDVGQQRRNRRP